MVTKLKLYRLRLNSGGYSNGVYYGHGGGIWEFDHPERPGETGNVRALDRASAKAAIRCHWPHARFYDDPKPSALGVHLAAVRSGFVDRTNIIGMRKAINAAERRAAGYSIGYTTPRVSLAETDALESEIDKRRPMVTGDLHDSGAKLLRSKRYARRLAAVADIIADLHSFRLVRFDRIGRVHCAPVYQAIASDGRSFIFRNIPWQSGGNGPEIL